jgi:hypothetical protein
MIAARRWRASGPDAAMFSISLRNELHIRRYSVLPLSGRGWEVKRFFSVFSPLLRFSM